MLAGTLQTWIKRRIAVRQRLGRMCTSYLLFLMEGMDFFGKGYPKPRQNLRYISAEIN